MKADQLKQKLRSLREIIPQSHATRIHRGISWLRCAERYLDDDDVGYITLWISFNTAYGIDESSCQLTERDSFIQFINQIVRLDADRRIYDCMWLNYSNFIKAVLDNHYIYQPFWKAQSEVDHDWETPFKRSRKLALHALANEDVPLLLTIVLDRLYVLRNQLIHGGATYESSVNRAQVKDGKRLLLELMPLIIDIMLDNPESDWGRIFYPVV